MTKQVAALRFQIKRLDLKMNFKWRQQFMSRPELGLRASRLNAVASPFFCLLIQAPRRRVANRGRCPPPPPARPGAPGTSRWK